MVDPDLLARDAWAKMKQGVSLRDCAYQARLHVAELDRMIWDWRYRVVRKPVPDDGLAVRRFSWQ